MKRSQALPSLVAIVLLATGDLCFAEDTKTQALLAQSDPVVQQRIRDLLAALHPERNPERSKHIEALRGAVDDEDDLVRQVAIFVATAEFLQEPAIECIVAYRVLDQLDVQPKSIIRTFSDYLLSENELLRGFVRVWFQGYSEAREEPYDDYKDYMIAELCKDQEIPQAFVEHLFERSPGRALLAFNGVARSGNLMDQLVAMRKKHNADAVERRKRGENALLLPAVEDLPCPMVPRLAFDEIQKIRLAEHLVSHAIWLKAKPFEGRRLEAATADAREQLEKLSRHEQWWARRYAVEIMRRQRHLRLPEALETLRQDSNELVRKPAKAIPE